MDGLLAAVMRHVTAHLEGPFALFGHSFGALVAFELCCRLAETIGTEPLCLFVSGRRPPQLPSRQPPAHALPRDAFLARVEQLHGIPPEVLADRALMDAFLPALRADYQVNETYVPRPIVARPIPIVAMVGERDPLASVGEMLGWRDLTSTRFSLSVFAGDHFYLREPARLLAVIRGELELAVASVAHARSEVRGQPALPHLRSAPWASASSH
jgi:surfactin synthase thioesterase subunit